MKRPNSSHKMHLARLERKRRRRQRRLGKRCGGRDKSESKAVTITFPEEITVHGEGAQSLARKIKELVSFARKNDVVITLDMSQVRRIHAIGMILLHANVSKVVDQRGDSIELNCTLPNENTPREVLKQVGFLSLVGHDNSDDIVPSEEDVVHWTSTRGIGAQGEKFDDVIHDYFRTRIPGQFDEELYNSVTEAMTNVSKHAYINLKKPEMSDRYKPWWMFSQIRDDTLTVVFCDLGVGIPKTLPYRHQGVVSKLLKASNGARSDGKAIHYAIKESISRTLKKHRGRGLGQITNSILGCEGGKVVIFSNQGYYRRESGNPHPSYGKINESICGTIISWQVPLLSSNSGSSNGYN